MSKQNRCSPKYILIASPAPEETRPKAALKKRTLQALRETDVEKTAPTLWQSSKRLLTKESVRSFSRETGKGMESLRAELGDCMAMLVEEERKNSVLQELVRVVGEEMQRAAEAERRVEREEVEASVKRAQKVEYDIEQILQKHNEEVAKINTLKEQVASARSDRVVFSNLFRKLEKEIKRSEEYYRSLTLTTEIYRQRKAQKQLRIREMQQQPSVDEIEPRDDNRRPSGSQKIVKTAASQESKVFLTLPREKLDNTSPNKRASFRSPQGSVSSKRLRYMIESIETKIEKLAKTGDCDNWAQAMEYYGSVEEENGRLLGLIAEEEQRIEAVEAEIDRIRLQRRISQIYDDRQLGKLESLASTRKIRSIKHISTTLTEQNEKIDEDAEILADIFEVLGLPHEANLEQVAGREEVMRELWLKLEPLESGKAFKKSDSSLSNASGEHDLDNLLSKMQKFDACDRILSRKQFYTEYVREVSRNKRSFRRK